MKTKILLDGYEHKLLSVRANVREHTYHENGIADIIIETDKGKLKIWSCNNCEELLSEFIEKGDKDE